MNEGQGKNVNKTTIRKYQMLKSLSFGHVALGRL